MNPREQLLHDGLVAAFRGFSFRVVFSSASWIIEAISPTITPANKRATTERIFETIDRTLGLGEHVWKLFVYDNERDRFLVNATLHTVMFSYSNEGIFSTTLAAEDCYLDITEFDAEVLQLGYRAGMTVLGKESMGSDGNPILGFSPTSRFVWMETLGGHYDIDPDGITIDANRTVAVTLGQ